jgi:glycosyltransferase involved in cell wall biosynthesis
MSQSPLAAVTPPSFAPRILFSGGLATGGVQTHVRILCQVLREAGARVTIAASANEWPAEEVRGVRDLGVRILTTPFGYGRWAKLGKVQAICTWPLLLRRFDTLYCHGRGLMHVWMRRFLRPGGWAVYHELVDAEEIGGQVTRVLSRADAVIANSAPVAAGLHAKRPDVPLRVLPFLTSTAPLPPPPPRPAAGGRELRVAYLGRTVPHKHPDWLVERWPQILRHGTVAPARLDVYGSDPGERELNRLRNWVRDHKLESLVRLHGAYTSAELPGILARTDLVVLPSVWEGLPLVLVEAMLHGVPFVSTDAGGTAELANPDVEITPIAFEHVVEGIGRLAERLRAGRVEARRLFDWADARYGYSAIAGRWRQALLCPQTFFAPAAG